MGDDNFFQAYKPDSKPNGPVDEQEFEKIKRLLVNSLDQLREDYNHNLFTNYPAWTTCYGVEISNIDNAIAFYLFTRVYILGILLQ